MQKQRTPVGVRCLSKNRVVVSSYRRFFRRDDPEEEDEREDFEERERLDRLDERLEPDRLERDLERDADWERLERPELDVVRRFRVLDRGDSRVPDRVDRVRRVAEDGFRRVEFDRLVGRRVLRDCGLIRVDDRVLFVRERLVAERGGTLLKTCVCGDEGL